MAYTPDMTETDWKHTPAGKKFLLLHGGKRHVQMTRLAHARLTRGWSVADAANACDLNKRTWENWEQRRKPPSKGALSMLSIVFPEIPAGETVAVVTVSTKTLKPIGRPPRHAGGAR